MSNGGPQSCQKLYFDPDLHSYNTLKAFEDVNQVYELRYEAQYPDPPKVSLDSATQRWTYTNATEANAEPKPTLAQYDEIVCEWQSKDMVAKLLGIYSSNKLYLDWCNAKPDAIRRKAIKWDELSYKNEDFV